MRGARASRAVAVDIGREVFHQVEVHQEAALEAASTNSSTRPIAVAGRLVADDRETQHLWDGGGVGGPRPETEGG